MGLDVSTDGLPSRVLASPPEDAGTGRGAPAAAEGGTTRVEVGGVGRMKFRLEPNS